MEPNSRNYQHPSLYNSNENPHHYHQSYNLQDPTSYSIQKPILNLNLNHNTNEENLQHIQKEVLFEKLLTPSDVGKLNRLVIPKQNAEKYFPMGSANGNSGGVILSFEDELGKCWSFRYSYWNSSQSYVLTRGWSKYVKEKQLDAGDVVFFEKLTGFEGDHKLFIGWRRKTADHRGYAFEANYGVPSSSSDLHHLQAYIVVQNGLQLQGAIATGVPYQVNAIHAGNSRRVRLFGVNLEYQLDESEPSTYHHDPSTYHHDHPNTA